RMLSITEAQNRTQKPAYSTPSAGFASLNGHLRHEFVDGSHRGKLRDLASRLAAVGPGDRIDPADAEIARSPQHRKAVVHEQGAGAVEPLHFEERAPEGRAFLGRTERMRGVNRIEVPTEIEVLVLDRERRRVRVGDEGQALAQAPDAEHEALGFGVPLDQLA